MFILVSKSAICARNVQSSAGAGRTQRIAGTANVAPVVVCNESKKLSWWRRRRRRRRQQVDRRGLAINELGRQSNCKWLATYPDRPAAVLGGTHRSGTQWYAGCPAPNGRRCASSWPAAADAPAQCTRIVPCRPRPLLYLSGAANGIAGF